MQWRLRSLILGLLLPLIMMSCGGRPPVIQDLQWNLFYRDDGTHRYEELLLLFRVNDADDIEDPALAEVRLGDTGLLWQFPRNSWKLGSDGEVEWWGLPAMIPLEDFRFPSGLFVLRVEDLSGRSDEMTFRLPSSRLREEELEWPRPTFEKDLFRLDETYPKAFVFLRDEAGRSRRSGEITDGTSFLANEAVEWEAWIPLEDSGTGFRLGPYPLSSTE